MSHFVYDDCKIYLHTHDLSGHSNAFTFQRSQATPDDSNFGDTFFNALPGPRSLEFSAAGKLDFALTGVVASQDGLIDSRFAVADVPLLWSPDGGAAGQTAYFGKVLLGEYQCGGPFGETAPWTLSGRLSTVEWIRGMILRAHSAITGTFNGTAFELGAVSASQFLYGDVHVTVDDVTSMTLKIQSASDQAFTSPNDRITFTVISGITSEIPTRVAGAISDTWWRVVCSSFTGTSATAVIAAGIQ